MEILVFPIIAIMLFVSAYITKRRFGLLGLALAAGSLLSVIWGFDAGLVAGFFSIPSGPLTSALISSLLVLLPAGLLLFHGSTYKTIIGRVIGASLFTLLAMAFLIEPLSHAVVVQGFGSNVYAWLVANRNMVEGVGLIAAIIDLFLTKPAHLSDKRHKR